MKSCLVLSILLFEISLSIKAQLNIYGGKNHDQFLGCIECSTEDLNSIWSPYSNYGIIHGANSIWNPDGKFGSKTSNYSPFNESAKYPPVIMDKSGKFYGYFTINKKFPNRSINGLANDICERRERIVKDIPGYYDSIYKKVY